MIVYHCKSCDTGYGVSPTDDRLDLLSLKMPCPKCSEGSLVISNREAQVFKFVSAEGLYQAAMGLGFDEERDCRLESVKQLMEGSTIVEVDLEPSSQEHRTYAHSVTVDQGGRVYKLFLATSPGGPLVYRRQEITQ